MFSWNTAGPPDDTDDDPTSGSDEPFTPTMLLVLGVICMACFSVIVAAAIARLIVPVGLTPLTFPFQVSTWLWLLGAQAWGHVTTMYAPDPVLMDPAAHFETHSYDAAQMVEACFCGISQTFLVSQWYAGVLMLVGIALCSRISAVWALVGSAVGCLLAAALGVHPEHIYTGLHGYNSCLCAMALGGFFIVQHNYKATGIAVMGAVCAEVATTATASLFAPIGLPALTWPFTWITWVMLLSTSSLPNVIMVAISSLTTAEDHRERMNLSLSITSHFSVVSRFAESHQQVKSAEDITRIEATLLPIALCSVAAAGKHDILENLISLGAESNSADYDGRTPLHLACAEAHVGIVRLLLEAGADVNAKDCFGGTPLDDTIRKRALDISSQEVIVSLLVAHGAHLSSTLVNGARLGHILCDLAAAGDTKHIQLYLTAGAPVNAVDYDGRSAMHLAACGANGDRDA